MYAIRSYYVQRIIDDAFERRDSITPNSVDPIVREAILQTIEMLDSYNFV